MLVVLLAIILGPFIQPSTGSAQGRAGEDLTVLSGSYAINPSPPRLQEVLTVNVTVINQGTQNAGSFVVAFHLNNTTNPLNRNNYRITVNSLAQGATANVSCTWDTRTTETVYFLSGINYTIIVSVDYNNAIPEQDETNNNFTVNQTLGPERAPDLKLVSFSVNPSNPTRGYPVTVEVRITNTGEITAKFFKVYIYADDIINTIASTDASPLNVSDFRNITLVWNTSGHSTGAHNILVYVNPEFYFNKINELDWSNNNGSRRVVIVAPEQRLELVAFDISPAQPHLGDMLAVNCTIRNNGSADENFTALVLFDSGEILNRSIGLGVRGSVTLEAKVDTSVFAEGNHTVRVLAGNMDRSADIAILPMRLADIVPQKITFLPLLPKVGQKVGISLEAANIGSAPSNPCTLALFADYIILPVASAEVPSIPPDGARVMALEWNTSGMTAGSHWLRLTVDSGKVVAESNETNNNYVWTLALSGEPDLLLENLTIRPTSPRVGETAQFSVRVRNIGSMSCGASNLTLKMGGEAVDAKALGMIYSGGAQNATLKWSTAAFAPGPWDYEMSIEPSAGTTDANGRNNILAGQLELQPPPPAPDLRVSGIVIGSELPTVGDTLTIRVIVENAGNQDSGPSTLMVYLENGSSLIKFTDVPAPVPALPAGTSAPVEVSRMTKGFRAGSYVVNATVDFSNEIHELNESNNHVSVRMELYPPPQKIPSLKVEAVSLEGEMEKGAHVNILATVTNTGEVDAYNVRVWFIIDGVNVGNVTLDQVKMGANRTASYMWKPAAGAHTVSARAEGDDAPPASGPQRQVTVADTPPAGGGNGSAGMILPLAALVVSLCAAGAAAYVLVQRRRKTSSGPDGSPQDAGDGPVSEGSDGRPPDV